MWTCVCVCVTSVDDGNSFLLFDWRLIFDFFFLRLNKADNFGNLEKLYGNARKCIKLTMVR